jgi:hypothetical protein
MTSKYRISVPKAVKDRLWDITFGQDAGQGKCYVCDTIINSKRFEAGHIISVKYGGPTTLNNLKCICSTCNKSMGAKNLEDFKKTYFPAISKKIKLETNTCQCCHKNINFDLFNKKQEHNLSNDRILEHNLSNDKILEHNLSNDRILEHNLSNDKILEHNLSNDKILEHNLSDDRILEHNLSDDRIRKQKLDLFFNKFLYIPK